MNKFIIVSSLMLFWAFFEESGGFDFVPPSERETQEMVAIAPATHFDFRDTYVPFNAPVILATTTEQTPDQPTDIVQASYTGTASLETIVTAEPSVIRTVAPTDVVDDQPKAAEVVREDIRIVAGDRVNLRQGPGTEFGIVDTLPQGTEAVVIAENDDDWAQIRLLNGNQTGWMAAWLLSD